MIKKVKILYLVTESEWAGASRYVYDLAASLPHDEFDIAVAAAGKGEVLTALEKMKIKTVKLRWLPRAIRPLKDFLAFWEILFLYLRERPDIIHLNSSKAGFIGSMAAALYRVVIKTRSRFYYNYYRRTSRHTFIVYTAHGWVFNEPGRASWFFRWLERFASYFRDAIICVSENDQQEGLRFRIAPEDKLVTIHNGIDPAAMRFLDREAARRTILKHKSRIIGHGAKLIGTVANLYPNKGLEYLIKAISLIKKQNADLSIHDPCLRCSAPSDSAKTQAFCRGFIIHAVIIGEGPLRQSLEALIQRHGLQDRVFLPGSIAEAWRYMKAFDCFVLPSIKEGLPYAVLEALAAGIPVVATRVGGVPEITQRTTFHLVSPHDPKALTDALLETLEKELPHELDFPSEFTLKTMVEHTRQTYARIVLRQ